MHLKDYYRKKGRKNLGQINTQISTHVSALSLDVRTSGKASLTP